MAATNNEPEVYEPKAIISKIQATSRMSLKISRSGKEQYYTIEYSEERVIPDIDGVDIDKEREALWDAVNEQCDEQAAVIYETFASPKNLG